MFFHRIAFSTILPHIHQNWFKRTISLYYYHYYYYIIFEVIKKVKGICHENLNTRYPLLLYLLFVYHIINKYEEKIVVITLVIVAVAE